MKMTLAEMTGTVDDEYFEQEKLDLRVQILIEDMSNVLAGDENLPPA